MATVEFLENSVFFGVIISLGAYGVGMFLKKKTGLAVFNPLLIAVAIVIAFLAVTKIDYQKYYAGAKYISYLLTPATVALAIPLYRQFELLKHNIKAILCGIFSGAVTSFLCVLAMAFIFRFSHEEYVTYRNRNGGFGGTWRICCNNGCDNHNNGNIRKYNR